MAFSVRCRELNVPPKKFREGGRVHYRVKIWIRATETDSLDDIQKVMYQLHKSFKDPERIVDDRKSRFALKIWTYGFFDMEAKLTLNSGRPFTIRGRVEW